MVEVMMVQPRQLDVPWAEARSDDGRHVLFLRDDASLVEVLDGYKWAHRADHVA